RDPKANQFRLILHTAAYWLMLTARNAIAKRLPLAVAEFATLRLRLIKIAARVIEGTARIVSTCPPHVPIVPSSANSQGGSAQPDRERRGTVAASRPPVATSNPQKHNRNSPRRHHP